MKRITFILIAFLCTVFVYAEGLRVLYIGDSITDGNWGNNAKGQSSSQRNLWDMNHIYGSGYMYLCASYYQGSYPEKEYEFFNRGISGNTLDDLAKRWDVDVIDMKPDVLSVLIGTNDVANYLKKTGSEPFNFVKWGSIYRSLLDKALKSNPRLKLVLGAPFVANTGKMRQTTNFAKRDLLVRRCAAIVEQIAKDYKAVYLPYNTMFDHILKTEPTSKDSYWIWDGIHPTAAGHQRMANLWIQQISKKHLLQ
jgi:lysophospholipase L1-like esterase